MSESKKESHCFSSCSNNACCNFVNEAISGYFRDSNTALAAAINAIILAFPFPLVTQAQITALTANCGTIGTIVANAQLSQGQSDAVSEVLSAFGITLPVGTTSLTTVQLAALTGLCATFGAATAGTPITPGSTLANANAALLDAFVSPAAGAAFSTNLSTIAAERTARIVALKAKFDDINRVLLEALSQLLKGECKDECCQSAADAIRVTASSFFRLAVATATNTGITSLPVPPFGAAPTPGSLQFLLANYDFEFESAVCVIVSTVVCFEEEEECPPCHKPCNNELKIKPKPKEHCAKPCFEEKKHERRWIEEEREKKCEEKEKHEEEKKPRKKDQRKPETYRRESYGENWNYNDNTTW